MNFMNTISNYIYNQLLTVIGIGLIFVGFVLASVIAIVYTLATGRSALYIRKSNAK